MSFEFIFSASYTLVRPDGPKHEMKLWEVYVAPDCQILGDAYHTGFGQHQPRRVISNLSSSKIQTLGIWMVLYTIITP
jgi:hypothetical protein